MFKIASTHYTVQPRYNEGPRDWQNVFPITRFRYIEVLFHTFYYCWSNSFVLPRISLCERFVISRFHCTQSSKTNHVPNLVSLGAQFLKARRYYRNILHVNQVKKLQTLFSFKTNVNFGGKFVKNQTAEQIRLLFTFLCLFISILNFIQNYSSQCINVANTRLPFS